MHKRCGEIGVDVCIIKISCLDRSYIFDPSPVAKSRSYSPPPADVFVPSPTRIQPRCNYNAKTARSHVSTIVYGQVLAYTVNWGKVEWTRLSQFRNGGNRTRTRSSPMTVWRSSHRANGTPERACLHACVRTCCRVCMWRAVFIAFSTRSYVNSGRVRVSALELVHTCMRPSLAEYVSMKNHSTDPIRGLIKLMCVHHARAQFRWCPDCWLFRKTWKVDVVVSYRIVQIIPEEGINITAVEQISLQFNRKVPLCLQYRWEPTEE